MDHKLVLRTEVLDHIAKSVMQSITANTKRRRRLTPNTKAEREAGVTDDLLREAREAIEEAQATSWTQ